MADFEGKVALITGAASGVGLATAELLAANGAVAVAADIAFAEHDSATALPGTSGGSVVAKRLDVSDEQDVVDLIEQVISDFGRLDVVVTSAGIQRYGTADDTDMDLWNKVLATNVTGTFLIVKHALPHLRASGAGSIVAVSSVQSQATQSGVAAYSMSKGAINAMIRSIAVDEAPRGVRANAVLPGSVDTPMLRASALRFGGDEDSALRLLADWGRSHPLGRIARPEEVAEAIAFLAGPRASFITGTCIPVDGGLLATLPVAVSGGESIT